MSVWGIIGIIFLFLILAALVGIGVLVYFRGLCFPIFGCIISPAKESDGATCTKDADCKSGGCGRPTADSDSLVCCTKAALAKGQTFDAKDYCYDMPDGAKCWSDAMCTSGYCQGNVGITTMGVCVSTDQPDGSVCKKDEECSSGGCGRPTADSDKLVCCTKAALEKGHTFGTKDYCYDMPDGAKCWSDAMCTSGYCQGNVGFTTMGTCVNTEKKDGETCKKDAECESGGCGRPTANSNSLVCCSEAALKRGHTFDGKDYCYSMPIGAKCWSDAMCTSGYCQGNFGITKMGTCTSTAGRDGSACTKDAQCQSGGCGRPTADSDKLVCCTKAALAKGHTFDFKDYCYDMPIGAKCWSDAMCTSGYCKGNFGITKMGVCTRK